MNEREPSSVRPIPQLKDARGVRVTLLDPYDMYLLRKHDVIPLAVLKDIAEEIGSGLTMANRIGLRATLFCAVCFGVTVVNLIIQAWGGTAGSPGLVKYTLLLGATLGSLCIVWIEARRRRFHRIERAMLKRLHCPHCGYDLRMLPVDPEDGATICPECGYAWKPDGLDST
ncbi:MAG: hypothetical protein JSU63_05880 [Phycisphaerales bacterium]|nr:MAG: hypothetical protein JSU63_05880 [Phycisphaerales bacterium]